MILLTEIQYNPGIAYFQQLNRAEGLMLEKQEHYIKQSYRNRCRILTAQGPLDLAIPVMKGNRKTKICELEIDYSQNWVNMHWRSIRSAYGSAPFYAYYCDYLADIYHSRQALLWEFDLALLRFYLKCLNIKKPILFTESYMPGYGAEVADLRNKIHPKRQPDNLDIKPYPQVFGKQFVSDLSIIDVLFSQGPEAITYL